MYRPKAKLPLVLRQPPPPIRSHKTGSTMHGTMDTHLNTVSEIASGSNCSYVAGRTRPYFFRRCKRKMLKTTNIESLPDDIILEILVRVPAQDIYDTTRLVCRKWYKIIHAHDFIHAHLQQSNCGILAQHRGLSRHQLDFLETGKGLIEISKLNYHFTWEVLSSCNGLVLESPNIFHDNLYITNPVTKQNFALPLFLTNVIRYGYAIAYAATSMEYKVVRTFFINSKFMPHNHVIQDECVAIFTVGVDKDWTRRVNTRHISLTANYLFVSRRLLTTEGFVHWTINDSRVEYVLTLNVETEIITQFPVPRHDGETKLMHYYLPMRSYLSLLIARSKFSWEFWEMKPDTGEWTKLPNIDLEAQFASYLNCRFTPGGWLKSREVLVFNVRHENYNLPTRLCIVCNVRTREFQKFKLDGDLKSFLAHRNSLVWMDGSQV